MSLSTYVGAHKGEAVDECKAESFGPQCIHEAELWLNKVRNLVTVGLWIETENKVCWVLCQILIVGRIRQACKLKGDVGDSLEVMNDDSPQ